MASSSGVLKRWLLINYSGYPFALNSLILDNGLANLAGVLIQAGCEVRILDYATVSMLQRLTPPELHGRLRRAWSGIMPPDGRRPGALTKLRIVASLQAAERQRQRYQEQLLSRIAEEVVQTVQREGIEAIGFKLWNGDGIRGATVIATAVRKACPQVRLFGGGPQVDIFMENLLDQCAAFDAISFGEGEVTIRRLAESGGNPAAYASLPNLLFRQNGQTFTTEAQPVEDLDSIPLPVYDPAVYPAAAGNEKIRIIVIDDSRGCGNNCAFCIHPIKSSRDRRIRLKSVGHLADEVQALRDRYGVRTFRFAGSCTPYEHLRAFADEVLRRKMDILYASFAHVRDSAASDYEVIRRSGCAALFFGVESGDQRILDGMRKGIRAADIPKAIEHAKSAGIYTVGSLIFPAPLEDAKSEEATLELMKLVRPSGLTIQPPLVIPRTDWFNRPERYGIEFRRGKERFVRNGMQWKAKNLLPVAFWTPLPVWVGGRGFKQVLKKAGEFTRRCEDAGIPTCVSDDTYLMSLRAHVDPLPFRDATREAFFTGDYKKVSALVGQINPEL